MPIELTDEITPLGSFPLLNDSYLKGGWQTVLNGTARDAIPAASRKIGMVVYTTATSQAWVLGPGITNSDWTLFASGVSAHAASHRPDGSDPLSTAAPVQGIGGGNSVGTGTSFARNDHDHKLRTTTGPTDLTIAGIADGQLLKRSGTDIVGLTNTSRDLLVDAIATPDGFSIFQDIETMYAATVALAGLKRVTFVDDISVTATNLDLNKYAFIGTRGGNTTLTITLHGTMVTPPHLLKNIRLVAGTDVTPCLTLTANAVTRLEDASIGYGSSGGYCILGDYEYDIYLYGYSSVGNQFAFIMSGNSYLYLVTHDNPDLDLFMSGTGGTFEHANFSTSFKLSNITTWSGGTRVFVNNVELVAPPYSYYLQVTSNATPYVFEYIPNIIANDSVFSFTAKVLAIDAASGDVASYELLGLFYINGSGTISQKGTTTVVNTYEDDAAWDCTLATDGTVLQVTVTGGAGVDVSWRLYGSTVFHESVPAPP